MGPITGVILTGSAMFDAQRLNPFDVARNTMIDTQIRPSDVTDPRVLSAIAMVARENFLPRSSRALSYADVPVEVANGRFLLEPRCFAKLLQLAAITPDDRILDVGCATGYSAAVLARLGGEVFALEQDADLVRQAVESLETIKVTVVQGALIEGVKNESPFDVIFVEGAIEQVPETLLSQLAEGGRLVAVLNEPGNPQAGKATLFLKEQGTVGRRAAFDAAAPLLSGFKKAMGFIF
jgi:protein-L-isoaspartate(D-aspartate) O-methyltransferase